MLPEQKMDVLFYASVGLLLILVFLKGTKEGYGYFPPKYSTYLQNYYNKTQGTGYQQERQDICEKQNGVRCALSSGVSGICGLNGKCVSFHGNDSEPFPLPLPYSQGDCPIYCRNHTDGSAEAMDACIKDCGLNYYPDGY